MREILKKTKSRSSCESITLYPFDLEIDKETGQSNDSECCQANISRLANSINRLGYMQPTAPSYTKTILC